MRQNYQVRFLSRPGSRGRERDYFTRWFCGGERLGSDTYHTHTSPNVCRTFSPVFLDEVSENGPTAVIHSICVVEGNHSRYTETIATSHIVTPL